MEDPYLYRASSSKNTIQASYKKCFTQCPTCSSILNKDNTNYKIPKGYNHDTDSSEDDDDSGADESHNFLYKWDKYLSKLSNISSSSYKQAIFGLRHAIEEEKVSRRRSSIGSSRKERRSRGADRVSPRMSRLLEFMSENDMPSVSSTDPAFGRLFEYLDIKAGNISRDPSVHPPGKCMDQNPVPVPEYRSGHPDTETCAKCPICLDDLVAVQAGQQQQVMISELQCKHRFHVNCIERHFRWQSKKWCPVCTYNVPGNERSNRGSAGMDWRRFWVCFRGPFSRIIARNSPSSSPAK